MVLTAGLSGPSVIAVNVFAACFWSMGRRTFRRDIERMN